MQIEMIQALAAMRSTGIQVPPEALWLLEREIPEGVLKGTVVCVEGHDNAAGVKFCSECGVVHGRAWRDRPPGAPRGRCGGPGAFAPADAGEDVPGEAPARQGQ